MKVILVLSSWSSGSTSVAGFLHHAGAWTCPPYVGTSDPRTRNPYEPRAYRDALGELVDHYTLKKKGSVEDFVAFLEPWMEEEQRKAREAGATRIALKHPLQTFALPLLQQRYDCVHVVVSRPFDAIERSRRRRGWYPVYGKQGARIIYRTLHGALQERGTPYLHVPYASFRSDPDLQQHLLDWVGLDPSPEQRQAAQAWLR